MQQQISVITLGIRDPLALVHKVRSPAEVQPLLYRLATHGGFRSYFADLDEHAWESPGTRPGRSMPTAI